MPSLKKRIYKYLTLSGEYVAGSKIEVLASKVGFAPSNAGRRLRELAESGLIERKLQNGHVYYRSLTKPKEWKIIVRNGEEVAIQV